MNGMDFTGTEADPLRQWFIVYCKQDESFSLIDDTEAVCDKNSLALGDKLKFMYGNEEYEGIVRAIGGDEEYDKLVIRLKELNASNKKKDVSFHADMPRRTRGGKYAEAVDALKLRTKQAVKSRSKPPESKVSESSSGSETNDVSDGASTSPLSSPLPEDRLDNCKAAQLKRQGAANDIRVLKKLRTANSTDKKADSKTARTSIMGSQPNLSGCNFNSDSDADEGSKIDSKMKNSEFDLDKMEMEEILTKEEEAKSKAQQNKREAEVKKKRELEGKQKKEAEDKKKMDAEEKKKRAADEKKKRDAEERKKKEAADKKKRETEDKKKREIEDKKKREIEDKTKKEEYYQKKKEAEQRKTRDAERKKRQEAEERKKQEAEAKKRREEEQIKKKTKEEDEKKQREFEKKKRNVVERSKDGDKNMKNPSFAFCSFEENSDGFDSNWDNTEQMMTDSETEDWQENKRKEETGNNESEEERSQSEKEDNKKSRRKMKETKEKDPLLEIDFEVLRCSEEDPNVVEVKGKSANLSHKSFFISNIDMQKARAAKAASTFAKALLVGAFTDEALYKCTVSGGEYRAGGRANITRKPPLPADVLAVIVDNALYRQLKHKWSPNLTRKEILGGLRQKLVDVRPRLRKKFE